MGFHQNVLFEDPSDSDYAVSFNPHCPDSDGPETALITGRDSDKVYKILDGDHRAQINKAFDEGGKTAVISYFEERKANWSSMSTHRHFPGTYPPDWKEIQSRVIEAAGRRCIRCGHPYRRGAHGTGEWSPCDDRCSHDGPVRPIWTDGVEEKGAGIEAQWRILTTHHFDGNKGNNLWWNLLVLCQRCHLQIQGKVNPETPYFLEHSKWINPYIAGFYAAKYLREDLTRDQVMDWLDELLALEQRV